MRAHDQEQEDLEAIPGLEPPLDADADELGFPDYNPAEDGERPPRPPNVEGRDPTPEEAEALDELGPGVIDSDPCVDPDAPVREYTIVALPSNIVYNDAGDHDPDGVTYVLEEDAEAVRNGDMNPEPLIIRANLGECVEITLQNEIPEEFDLSISAHTHFVGFDVQGSDGTMVGRNYDSSAPPGGEITYRWFADEEGPIFFHDHFQSLETGPAGLFAALIVEPAGSEWLDPHTGEEIQSGTQAMITGHDDEDFREFALMYHDFAPLVDLDGNLLEEDMQHGVNAGVMAINYRNAPYFRRDDEDPVFVHSSAVHGDPATPLLEAYEGDPVTVRLIQGAYEEQHNFTTFGLRTDPEGLDLEDSVSQVIGTSEQFEFHFQEDMEFDRLENPSGLPIRDYMYGSNIVDDMWSGMWGIFRSLGGEVDHLQPLPDSGAPDQQISNDELREMGHPAPFSNWTENGHKDKLLYDEDNDRDLPPDHDERRNESIGEIPSQALDPGDPCPDDAPVRQFNVTAIQVPIEYNDYGDNDPHGIVYVLDEHVEEVQEGVRPVEPFVIRANEGDCIEINLTNGLSEDLDNDHAHPQVRAEMDWERSNRISMHPNRIQYDVNGSDGTTVGFNHDQTVEPGETITYRWFADEQLDGCILWDMADLRSNRHHGAFGQLLIESPDSAWLAPSTAEPRPNGSMAMVTNGEDEIRQPMVDGEPVDGVETTNDARPTFGEEGRADDVDAEADFEDFREFTLAYNDGAYVINPDGTCVVPPEGAEGHDHGDTEDNGDVGDANDEEQEDGDVCTQLGDPEDQGFGGINFRSEPFRRRFDNEDEQHLVFNSEVHGDPNTPILNAFLNDPVTFRVGLTADKQRGMSWHLANHQWNEWRGVDESRDISVEDKFTPGKQLRTDLLGGAGGFAEDTGDFIYMEMKQRIRLEMGLWGIFRVEEETNEFEESVQPLPERADEVPLEERPGWAVDIADMNENDAPDIAIGVPESDIGTYNGGAVYVFFDADEKDITDLSDADVQLLGTTPEEQTGMDVTIVDANDINAIDMDSEADAAIIVETAMDESYIIEAGNGFEEMAEGMVNEEMMEFLDNTTENDIDATVMLEEVSEVIDNGDISDIVDNDDDEITQNDVDGTEAE